MAALSGMCRLQQPCTCVWRHRPFPGADLAGGRLPGGQGLDAGRARCSRARSGAGVHNWSHTLWRESREDCQLAAVVRTGGRGPGISGTRPASVGLPRLGAGNRAVRWLDGQGPEELTARTGEGIGGLLNATFGNAAELIIAFAALRAGLHDVVKASLAGSIISVAIALVLLVTYALNLLFVLVTHRTYFSGSAAAEHAGARRGAWGGRSACWPWRPSALHG
jgi:hypothetical protein